MAKARAKSSRHKKEHPLVPAAHSVVWDEPDSCVVVVPVHTRNFANLQTGNSKIAGIMRKRERAKHRGAVLFWLSTWRVPKHFRGIRMVRLAPSNGLDTGGLWNALKAPQDGVAEYLGIDDGPKSPATWEMAQERATGYGVRIELRVERADAK